MIMSSGKSVIPIFAWHPIMQWTHHMMNGCVRELKLEYPALYCMSGVYQCQVTNTDGSSISTRKSDVLPGITKGINCVSIILLVLSPQVIERVHRSALLNIVVEAPISFMDRAKIIHQVACALAYLHCGAPACVFRDTKR